MEAARRGTTGSRTRRLAALAATLSLIVLAPATASAAPAHGQLLSLRAHTSQSNNWFGYQLAGLGTLGNVAAPRLFNTITGDWTVPTATAHTGASADQASSDWIGIGGGCADTGCVTQDETLIQTGTEQDVGASGQGAYSAWVEVIPGPSLTVSLTVNPGDRMHAEISEVATGSSLWNITLTDTTTGKTSKTTLPYTSGRLSAEWIEETPLLISSASLATLPNLTDPAFDHATVNGAPANLVSSNQVQLVDNNNIVYGAPSNPDSDGDGFSACTYAKTCALGFGS